MDAEQACLHIEAIFPHFFRAAVLCRKGNTDNAGLGRKNPQGCSELTAIASSWPQGDHHLLIKKQHAYVGSVPGGILDLEWKPRRRFHHTPPQTARWSHFAPLRFVECRLPMLPNQSHDSVTSPTAGGARST